MNILMLSKTDLNLTKMHQKIKHHRVGNIAKWKSTRSAGMRFWSLIINTEGANALYRFFFLCQQSGFLWVHFPGILRVHFPGILRIQLLMSYADQDMPCCVLGQDNNLNVLQVNFLLKFLTSGENQL